MKKTMKMILYERILAAEAPARCAATRNFVSHKEDVPLTVKQSVIMLFAYSRCMGNDAAVSLPGSMAGPTKRLFATAAAENRSHDLPTLKLREAVIHPAPTIAIAEYMDRSSDLRVSNPEDRVRVTAFCKISLNEYKTEKPCEGIKTNKR
jgi:hypothetical protein